MTNHPASSAYALGVDYGTSSCRAVLVDVANGDELCESAYAYPTGVEGVIIDTNDPNLARQHPGDYTAGFVAVVRDVLAQAAQLDHFDVSRVVGLGIDTTGSTPIPVDADGTPLAMRDAFRENPHAQAWLWKDHTAHAEAAEITELARSRGEPYLDACGGVYSSEWFWSKVLRCKRVAPEVFEAAYSWVELADYLPAWACGNTRPGELVRGVCAAGHKAMYSERWGGLPSAEFLAKLDPDLAPLRDRLYGRAVASDQPAGCLDADIAERVGLPAGVPVAAGLFDAHAGAVGSGAAPGTLVKIIGTSTCDITVVPKERDFPMIPGVCGVVEGSVLPGAYGVEAGQSAVGDLLNWFVAHLSPEGGHAELTDRAAALAPGESGLLALDWNNGNRTVLVDPMLSGVLVGQTLHTTAGEVYRALIEATAFGARRIIEQIERYGPPIGRLVNCGGIAEKNPLFMQIYADVLGRPMEVSRATQTCAVGAAIFGALVGGAHADARSAQRAMTGVKDRVFEPDPGAAETYNELYELYLRLHDGFGGVRESVELGDVMKRLIRVRERARAKQPSRHGIGE